MTTFEDFYDDDDEDYKEQETERDTLRKIILGVLCVIFLLILLFQIGTDDDETIKTVPPPKQASSNKTMGKQIVLGIEDTKEKGELRNPFTPQHESERDATNNPTQNKSTMIDSTHTVAKVNVASPPKTHANKTNVPETPQLQGIASNGTTSLAIISVGDSTGTVAVGEQIGSWKVVRIDKGGVALSGADGSMYLTLGK